jgi:hypothetical protein
MRHEVVTSDITVVGGGLAGVCAAIAAARLGRRVALVTNRPVLGGNSSSEVRVWVCGATSHGVHHFAREGGVMGELLVENQYRNPEGNPYYWDLVVLDAVRAEPNITLFLNTDVREVAAGGPGDARRIDSVTGWMMGSERLIRFDSPLYLDCTGDGLVGHLAEARYRIGREARSEYGEPWAPETADDITLGSTLLFYTKDTGEPTQYVPPSFAKDITTTPIPEHRIIRAGDNGCAYWWIEWGGELDTVHDNDRIRDELWSVIYGIWDYIKNHGNFDADTMSLEWVGALPGKREYRRFVGDHTLTQHDIIDQVEFDDRVAFGGWSIDLHPPGGMYATEAGSKHLYSTGVYHVPYRSLYSVNCTNMLMAGRDISASHVAFGSTRVMATCGTLGEAAGTAAALCVQRGLDPRELSERHSGDLVQTLLRQDGSIVGLAAHDPADLAAAASVTASSYIRSPALRPNGETLELTSDIAVVVPAGPLLDSVSLLLSGDGEVTVEVCVGDRGQNYVPARRLASATATVAGDRPQWVRFVLAGQPIKLPEGLPVIVVLRSVPGVTVHLADNTVPGVLALINQPGKRSPDAQMPLGSQQVLAWRSIPLHRRTPAIRLSPDTDALAPARVLDGYQRPYGSGPHLWCSDPADDEPWLRLDWPQATTVRHIDVIFDDDVHEDLINLHHHRTPGREMPTLVRDYVIETAGPDGGWVEQHVETGNRRRHRVHDLTEAVTTTAVRLRLTATNGAPSAHVISLRVYA